MNQRFEIRQWIPVIITAAPALGYGLAYVYELGYCEAYHIPFDLIRLELTTILVAIAASLGGLAILAWLIFLLMSVPLYISETRKKIYFSVIYLIFLFLFALFYLNVEESKQLGIMYLTFVFVIFVIPWLSRKSHKKRKRQDIPINRFINNKYFKYGCVIIFIIISALTFGYLAGRSDAWKKEIFYVPSSHPQLVVLRIYDENIVCGELIQESEKFGLGPKIYLLKVYDSDLILTPIKVKLSFTKYPK